jgi:hypothetical protein
MEIYQEPAEPAEPAVSKAWGKNSVIAAMVILPFLKISHESKTFLVNLP